MGVRNWITGLSLRVLTSNSLAANLNKTSAVPTSYQDFIKPEYKDKLVLTYANDDDAVLYQFEVMYVHIHVPVFCMHID